MSKAVTKAEGRVDVVRPRDLHERRSREVGLLERRGRIDVRHLSLGRQAIAEPPGDAGAAGEAPSIPGPRKERDLRGADSLPDVIDRVGGAAEDVKAE